MHVWYIWRILWLFLVYNSGHLPPCFFLPLGVLPLQSSIFSFSSSHTDCVEALRVCSADPRCEALYRGLELCAADAAVSPLGKQVAAECLERQDALLGKHPGLSSCKCQRGLRKEEKCLHIYWSIRLMPGQSEFSWGWGMADKLSRHAYIGSSESVQPFHNNKWYWNRFISSYSHGIFQTNKILLLWISFKFLYMYYISVPHYINASL